MNRFMSLKNKSLCDENYKPLMKEIKEDLSAWRHVRVHGFEGSARQMSLLPKLTAVLTPFLSKSQQGFYRYRQAYSRIYMRKERPEITVSDRGE